MDEVQQCEVDKKSTVWRQDAPYCALCQKRFSGTHRQSQLHISRGPLVPCTMADASRSDGRRMAGEVWRCSQSGHAADTWRTHGGQAPGRWPYRGQPFYSFLRENPTVNCLGDN